MVLFEDTIYSWVVYIVNFIYINITVLIFVSLPGTIPVFIGIFSKLSLLDTKFCVSFRVSYTEIFLKSTPDILYFGCKGDVFLLDERRKNITSPCMYINICIQI